MYGVSDVRVVDMGGKDMRLAVMDAYEGDVPGIGDRLGRRDADQQGADQPGGVRDGHEVDVVKTDPGCFQGLSNDRHQVPQVLARGKLRHYAAVLLVDVDL